MIKVENGMLVLDSTFTKDDVKAINDFVEIAKEQERERIVKVLEQHLIWSYDIGLGYKLGSQIDLYDLFELIRHKGEK